MHIDFTAYSAFTAYLDQQIRLEEMLAHPAYQTVFTHAARFGSSLNTRDVLDALQGAPSPFYGLRDLAENRPRIRLLVEEIRALCPAWQRDAARELACLLPDEDLSGVVIYPILGYDIGIGLGEVVCMNLNTRKYLADPPEFLAYLIHETAHVLYERSHPIPPLRAVQTHSAWLDYFGLWLQNEGFAVYASLRLRLERGILNDADYQVLLDPSHLSASLDEFHRTWQALRSPHMLAQAEYLELIFGDRRVTYRAGCQIFRCIEQREGLSGVRRAFYGSGREFLERYAGLLG